MKKRTDVDRLNAAIKKSLKGFIPPDDLSVTEWAEKKRRLSPESSAEPGRWKNRRTPYLVEPMNAFTDPRVRHIVLVAASQVGKTELELNIVGYIIDEDPGSILYIHPTNVDAKEFSKLRIGPMIRDCPTLNKKVAKTKSRDSNNTLMQKAYPGGLLTLCGSGEAHALASKPIRYVIGDERDRWATSAGTEGDPWELAMARQKTFYNAKAVEVSTPTIKGASPIDAAYNTGTMEIYVTQCPDCGEWHEITFESIRFEYDSYEVNHKKQYTVTDIKHVCPGCGCIHTEQKMKKQPCKWVAQNPDALKKGVRSFWLNAFISPWASWESIIVQYLQAIGDTKKLQVVYNTSFGKLWEDRGDLQSEDDMLKRREDYEAELPDGVLVLTCGIDTQDDRLEYEVVGHGHFGETWGIEKGVIPGRPDFDETWKALDTILDKRFKFKDGLSLKISIAFIDEGGHFTQDVRLQASRRMRKKLFCIKGSNDFNAPFTGPPTKQKIVIGGKHIGYAWQYSLGVSDGKQIIFDNLKVQTPGSRYCHFPRRDDYGPGFFKGLLSEHLVYNTNKKQPWEWEKIPGHERNEALDCRNYAMAAFKVLPTDLDAIERKLRELRTGKPAPEPATVIVQAAQKQQQKPKRKSGIQRMYEGW